MLGSIATGVILGIEAVMVYRQLDREGLLDPIKDKVSNLLKRNIKTYDIKNKPNNSIKAHIIKDIECVY